MEVPLFSIIIPTYNRPYQLASCLKSLCRLNYPSNKFEVILVNDGGNTPTDDVISTFNDRTNITVVNQTNKGPASARNNGARSANGEFLAFTDDDCLPEPNWLIALGDCLRDNPECIVGGSTVNLLHDNLYSTASQLICELAYKHYNADHKQSTFFCSNNTALSKQKFLEIGGFDESFKTAEDRELCKRWLNNGLKMIFVPDAMIFHAHRLSLVTFIKQHFNYGRGSFQFYNKKILHTPGYFRNLFKFNFNPNNLIVYPLSKHKALLGLKLVTLLILWQLANATGFLFELINQRLKLPKLQTEKRL